MEYVTWRRMTVAAETLVNTNTRLIDIALDCQFESQEAFKRAFKRQFGVPPGKYRKMNIPMRGRFCSRITANSLLVLMESKMMEPELRDVDGFKVVGLSAAFNRENNNEIAGLW